MHPFAAQATANILGNTQVIMDYGSCCGEDTWAPMLFLSNSAALYPFKAVTQALTIYTQKLWTAAPLW